MRLVNSRRLTGPNLDTREGAAVADVQFSAGTSDAAVALLIRLWQRELEQLCLRFELGAAPTTARRYAGGASLTLRAPIDRLYAAIELNDYAINRALTAVAAGASELPQEDAARVAELAQTFAAQRNPRLLALESEAAAHDAPFLWDDDIVSVGYGKHAQSWPADRLPEVAEVAWEGAAAIPVALITGTNGKTTTSRMLTRIVKTAGYNPGNTSSDGVSVGEVVVESGDWTGPGAARMVLRRPEVDFAVLETARGGILRRGLGVPRADVAIITNVSSDHLGDYGVNSVEAMAQVKAIVGKVVHAQGRVVLGADDPVLCQLDTAALFVAPVVWFAVDPGRPVLVEHLRNGGEAWVCEEGQLWRKVGDRRYLLLAASDIPATFGGAARHNIANALGAAAMAHAVGIDDHTIAAALRTFGAARRDNPGRADFRTIGGVRLLLDFGHNPHGLNAIFALVRSLLEAEPGRLFVATGQAGDRSDADIRGLCEVIGAAAPYRIYVREKERYLRGRQPGALIELFSGYFAELGLADIVRPAASEVEILQDALAAAQPGDLIVLTLYLERDAVDDYLQSLAE